MTISDVPTANAARRRRSRPRRHRLADAGKRRGDRRCQIAVQRWGELSPARDNVVVVLHALTGDSHITGPAGTGHPTPGWWDGVAGPGAPIDTNRWCAVATNVLGGCRGSTGPSSLRPRRKALGLKVSAGIGARPGRGGRRRAGRAGHHRGCRRRRRLDGRREGAGMDRRPPGQGQGRRCCWRSAHAPPPTRSAPRALRSRPSSPTRTGRTVTTTAPAVRRMLG